MERSHAMRLTDIRFAMWLADNFSHHRPQHSGSGGPDHGVGAGGRGGARSGKLYKYPTFA